MKVPPFPSDIGPPFLGGQGPVLFTEASPAPSPSAGRRGGGAQKLSSGHV